VSFCLPLEMEPSRLTKPPAAVLKHEKYSSPTCFRLPAADLASPAAPCSLPAGLPVASLAAPASLSAPALAFAGGVGQSHEQHVYTRRISRLIIAGAALIVHRAGCRPPTASHSDTIMHGLPGQPCPPASETSLDSAHLVGNAAQAGGANIDLQACAGGVEGYRLGGDVAAGLSREKKCRQRSSEHAMFSCETPERGMMCKSVSAAQPEGTV